MHLDSVDEQVRGTAYEVIDKLGNHWQLTICCLTRWRWEAKKIGSHETGAHGGYTSEDEAMAAARAWIREQKPA